MSHIRKTRSAPGEAPGLIEGRRSCVRSGFTLMELLQVMAIAALVMTMAAARIDWMSMQVSNTGREVMTTLLATQRLALLRQHAVVVAFDLANNRLRIHEDGNNNGKIDGGENVRFVTLDHATTFGRGAAPALPFGSNPVSFVRKQDGMPAVTFYRSGSASEMGGFYITSKRALGSSKHAKDARAVETSRATGRVSYLTYDGSAWRRGF